MQRALRSKSCWSATAGAAALLATAACGGGTAVPAAGARAEAPAAAAGPHTVVVFATASLRAPFTALARRYEADHPGAKVELHFDGGAQLFARMNAGERADLVAIGDSSQMSRFAAAVLLVPGTATELARNRLAIAVRHGNPQAVRTLRDLARPDVRTALGERSSSIGRHANWVLSRGRIEVVPTVRGATADAILARVAAGDADAAIVYATTAHDAAIVLVPIAEADNTPVLYSIATVRGAPELRGAAAFRALALADVGQSLLAAHGFLPIGAKAR